MLRLCRKQYIVDFYCAQVKLIIELDGSVHYEEGSQEKDEIRTRKLEKMGFTVVRILDPEIDENFKGVCEFIDNLVKESLPQSANADSSLV